MGWCSVTVVLVAAIVAVAVVVLARYVIAPTVRTLAREGAARAREEERAELGAHLHDVVLQELLLIQKRAADPEQVVRIARHTERGLRAWLAARRATATISSLPWSPSSRTSKTASLFVSRRSRPA